MNKTMTAANDSRMILDEQHVKIIFDGTMTRPQLDHPEGPAFDREGRALLRRGTGTDLSRVSGRSHDRTGR
jgi:hypothetical protein